MPERYDPEIDWTVINEMIRRGVQSDPTKWQDRTPEFGVVQVEHWPEGICLWVGGKIRWRSWRDQELWDVKWDVKA